MPRLSASEVAELAGGSLTGDPHAAGVGFSADSRTLRPGEVFVAVGTGHDHVPDAVRAGASYVVVERGDAVAGEATAVVVDDVLAALARMASAVRDRLGVKVVAITGSTGKTLTKDLSAAALGTCFKTHAAPGNYNTEVGVPFTVLGCPSDANALIVEIGARHGGEVGALARIVRPDVAILTGVGVAHLGEFGSREIIATTKCELLEELSASGTGIVPAGDDYLDVAAAACTGELVTVGAGGVVELGSTGVDTGWLLVGGRQVDFRLPVPGRALHRNAAMAVVAAAQLGVDPQDAADALGLAAVTGQRMHARNVAGRTLVDDTYNANPTSVAAALRTARELAGDAPAWAVLGLMAELGPIAEREHARAGRLAAALGYERVIAVGEQARPYARDAGDVVRLTDDPGHAAELAGSAPRGSTVLVKGSRAARLETVTAQLERFWESSAMVEEG